jgi:hypothetical protein
VPEPDEGPQALTAAVPGGAPPHHQALAEACCAALADWPVVFLRVVVRIDGQADLGRHPARWIRRELTATVDEALCGCPGNRCTSDGCRANRLLGRHGKGPMPDGEAWAPFVIRAADTMQGKISERGSLTFELVLAGHRSVEQLPSLVKALQAPREPRPHNPRVTWSAVHALRQRDGELVWRKVDPKEPPPLMPLDRLIRPVVRPGRLTLSFLSATPMGRQGEEGRPTPAFSLVMDRLSRSLGAWMGRTGHRGPRLPVDDLLRTAGGVKLVADHSRVLSLPAGLLGAAGSRGEDEGDDRTTSLLGSITWTGDFRGLAPVLRAAHYLGMGPGRQHGLGQISVR